MDRAAGAEGRVTPPSETLASNVATFASPALTSAADRPPIEPTVRGAYARAWAVFKRRFWWLLLMVIIAWVVSAAASGLVNGTGRLAGLLWFLLEFLVVTPLGFGVARAFLRAVRGSRPELADLLIVFRRNYVGGVLAGLLLGLAIVIGFALLVIPGLVLAVRLAFVPFLVADEGLGAIAALRASWRLTSGYSWTLVGAGLLGVALAIVGLILLVVGVIPASILVYLAFASLYAAINQRKGWDGAADESRSKADG